MRGPWSRAGLVLAVVLLADQVTKALVRDRVELGSQERLIPLVKLVHSRNSGVAFGQLQGAGVIVTLLIGAAMVALLVYVGRNARRPLIWLPAGLLLGGALGNVIDRVREGAVVDFLKLPHWPAFNVADSAITVGVLTLLFVLERGDGARGSG